VPIRCATGGGGILPPLEGIKGITTTEEIHMDTLTIVKTTLMNDLTGNEGWLPGDVFLFDGFAYMIGRSYGDDTAVILL